MKKELYQTKEITDDEVNLTQLLYLDTFIKPTVHAACLHVVGFNSILKTASSYC